jgi:hypothetical protein
LRSKLEFGHSRAHTCATSFVVAANAAYDDDNDDDIDIKITLMMKKWSQNNLSHSRDARPLVQMLVARLLRLCDGTGIAGTGHLYGSAAAAAAAEAAAAAAATPQQHASSIIGFCC